MDYIILGVVAAIILLCGHIGRKKGLVRIVLSMVATVVSVFGSSVLTKPVCELVKDKFNLIDKIKDIVAESFKDIKIEDISYIENMQLPKIIKEKMIEGVHGAEGTIKEYVIESIAAIALSAIVFMALFIIITVVLGIIISVADVITKLPIVRQANTVAGFVAGLIYGVMVVWIGMIILTAMSSIELAGDILLTIGNNKILSFMYDSNPIMSVLTDIIG